jgi:hypothetical protein
MEMIVRIELLIPSMQNGNEPEFAAQAAFLIQTKAQQGLGYGLEEDIEHGLLVAEDDRIEIVRKREDRVEVIDRQKLGLARLYPSFTWDVLTFGTMTIPA